MPLKIANMPKGQNFANRENYVKYNFSRLRLWWPPLIVMYMAISNPWVTIEGYSAMGPTRATMGSTTICRNVVASVKLMNKDLFGPRVDTTSFKSSQHRCPQSPCQSLYMSILFYSVLQ